MTYHVVGEEWRAIFILGPFDQLFGQRLDEVVGDGGRGKAGHHAEIIERFIVRTG